jgi:hypothetical protein
MKEDKKKAFMPKYKTRQWYPLKKGRRSGDKLNLCPSPSCIRGIVHDPIKGERLCLFCGGSGEIKKAA